MATFFLTTPICDTQAERAFWIGLNRMVVKVATALNATVEMGDSETLDGTIIRADFRQASRLIEWCAADFCITNLTCVADSEDEADGFYELIAAGFINIRGGEYVPREERAQ
jgi:hypothetical protein